MNRSIRTSVIMAFLVIHALIVRSADNPVNADIVVAIDGSGDFTTLQAAINAVPSNSDRATIIYIKRGLYNTEKLYIPADKKNLNLIGESRDETIISYHIYDCSSPESGNKCPAEDALKWTGENITTSATLTIYGDGFRAENLTIRNTAGPVGQALAIAVSSDKNMFINCNILGYQDTIYLWAAGKRTYFQNCLVVGRTDYIYGAGIAFFQSCEIRSWGGGWITAPATPLSQNYGYVFNECQLTFATGSPRSGDDGSNIALGRPWHDYPKVTWMNSYFCDKINPLGWPTTWNMAYASTSADLKLYEYKNNGPGADMSGRASWVGIRALTDIEAPNYTVQMVMAGTDNWDPTAEPPLVQVFNWTDSATTSYWLLADNWSPKEIPSAGKIANVDSGFILIADGDTFKADLNMNKGSAIDIAANSTVSYLSLSNAGILCSQAVSLSGKISTKDTNTLNISGTLTINALISGVHKFNLTDTGKVILNADNESYGGKWNVQKGKLEAAVESSLGKAGVSLASGAELIIGHNSAFHPTARLEVQSTSKLVLNGNVTLSEFFIDRVMQGLGEYNATTNPTLISGSGTLLVGRPDVFQFIGAVNGNWDNAMNFVPQLLPEAGELVICEREMETTSTVFKADLKLTSKGSIRLRGAHKCTGLITMEEGARFSYATSGAGFTLDAPILINGNVTFQMSSGNTAGSSMKLPGAIQGSYKATASNTRNMECTATVVLSGDNSSFNGIWDLTLPSFFATSVTAFEGAGKNAFGFGTIDVGNGNKVVLNHEECAGDTLILNITGTGKAVISKDVWVKKFILNSAVQDTGVYNSVTNPNIFEGSANLIVGRTKEIPDTNTTENIKINVVNPLTYHNKILEVNGTNIDVKVYDVNGILVAAMKQERYISLETLQPGIYIVRYVIDGSFGILKICL